MSGKQDLSGIASWKGSNSVVSQIKLGHGVIGGSCAVAAAVLGISPKSWRLNSGKTNKLAMFEMKFTAEEAE